MTLIADTPEVRFKIATYKSPKYPHPKQYRLTYESHYANFRWEAQVCDKPEYLQKTAEDYYSQWQQEQMNVLTP